MISVCMCTYNGERFIEEQLESILAQTLPADEVVICDDASTDGTLLRIQSFIGRHRLTGKWRLLVNTENKGYPENFYQTMDLCCGDVVFLSDQDDIWHRDKIRQMMQAFGEYPRARVVCCAYGVMDDRGRRRPGQPKAQQPVVRPTGLGQPKAQQSVVRPTGHRQRYISPSSKNDTEWISLPRVFYKSQWNGMALAYRRQWYEGQKDRLMQKKRTHPGQFAADLVCGECSEAVWGKIPHDILLAAMAAEEQGFLKLNRILAWHRSHGQNTGREERSLNKRLHKKRKLWEIKEYLAFLEEFQNRQVFCTEAGRQVLRQKQASLQDRYEALRSGRRWKVLRNAAEHGKMVRPATLVCDLLIVRQRE